MISKYSKSQSKISQRLFSTIKHDICVLGGGLSGATTLKKIEHHQPNMIQKYQQKKEKMNNVLVTDDTCHKMRYLGMTSHSRNRDPFDNSKMRDKKNVEKFWEGAAPVYKKLFKDTKQFDNSTVLKVDPESNTVHLSNGTVIEQKVLVVATGLNEDQDAIEGLKEAIVAKDEAGLRVGHPLGHPAYFQNKGWHMNSGLDSKAHGYLPYVSQSPNGEFVGKNFFYPHLAMGDRLQQSLLTSEIDPRTRNVDIRATINGEQRYNYLDKYNSIIKNQSDFYFTNTYWDKTLVKLDYQNQTMHFADSSTLQYRYLMIQPPCKPAAFIAESALADEEGFLDVDPATLQHKQYKNIMGVGQCTNIHKSGTFSSLMAIMKQADVVCENACHMLHDGEHHGEENAVVDPKIEKKEVPKKAHKIKTQDGHSISPIVLGSADSVVAETRQDWKEKEEFQGTAGMSQSSPSSLGFEMIHTTVDNYEKQILAGSQYGGWTYTPDFGGH